MAKKNKRRNLVQSYFNSVAPKSYQTQIKKATRILSNQLDIKPKKAAKLAGLFIQQPKAMGTGRPGGRYWR
jgi:hypothetical protein